MNEFRGRGNLADAPALKQVTVEDEQRAVAEMRVYFDRSVPNGDGERQDKGGFWLDVNAWGPRAEVIASHLMKGARIYAEGSLVQNAWQDSESGEPRSRMKLNADYVALDLSRVEKVTFRAARQSASVAEEEAQEA